MEKIKIDINTDLIPTHNFLYKGKRFPFNLSLMKCFSKYFNSNQDNFEDKTDIDLLEEFDGKIQLSDKSIQEFINFCEQQEITLNKYNAFSLYKLSNKFEVPSLSKLTLKFIDSHKKDLAVDFLIDEEETGTKDGEEMISQNLLDYINDDRLFSIKLPILYRIISKYFEYSTKEGKFEQPPQLIEFLIKCIDHYGRDASTLFENIDPKCVKKDTIKMLLTKYENKFDFRFMGTKWQLYILDHISDLKKEQKKIEKMQKKIWKLSSENAQLKRENEQLHAEISRLTNKESKFNSMLTQNNKEKEELNAEILRLNTEKEEMQEANMKLKSEYEKIQMKQDQIDEDIKLRNYKSSSKTLYVYNLSVRLDQCNQAITDPNIYYDLVKLFKPYGILEDHDSITIKTNKGQKGYPYSYAIVKLKTNEQASKAILDLNYKKIDGIPICLTFDDDVIKNIIHKNRGNLLIQNLSTSIKVSDLYDIFSQYGEIISCKISYYVVTDFQVSKGESRGYGYVQFLCLGDAINAMNNLDQIVINDRRISIYQYDEFKSIDMKETYFCCCVYNLPLDYNDIELKNLFAEYGDPCSCKIICPGFGLCTMDNHKNAVKVVEKLNGKVVKGNVISCKPELTIEYIKNQSIIQEKKWIDLFNKDEYKNKIVCVKSNNYMLTDKQLESAFSKFGNIETAEIIFDENGYINGFGLICFSKPEEALNCTRRSSLCCSGSINCIVSLVNEQTLFDIFTKVNYMVSSSSFLIVKYKILKKCTNYKQYLQRLDDMSSDQIESLAKNESLFNKFIKL